ncbi:excalibur calcium-binding domain-containing protein [Streptomyces sp. NPDC057287]|uniref:excalibur calcium-binding domain-containing protein n=1 Tax=Streptomyces sp. NPDC057287 TaxID=3346086 RepID=UPI00362A2CCE
MNTRVTKGRLTLTAGAAVLALTLTGCGDDGGASQDAKPVAATASPSAERTLALADDTAGAEAGQEITIAALANDLVKLEDGTDAALLSTYGAAEYDLTVESQAAHGTVTVEGAAFVYTPTGTYAGEDEFTYAVALKGRSKGPADDSAVVRITVSEPTPTPTPTPTPSRAPKAKATKTAEPSVYYENCDAARAAGAVPVRRGEPGYAAHLDRDGDGVGCEPYGSSGSSGGSSGGSSAGGSTGGGSTSYANCTAVRAAGAAPIHRGDPGYGSHLDRDGDGVACE